MKDLTSNIYFVLKIAPRSLFLACTVDSLLGFSLRCRLRMLKDVMMGQPQGGGGQKM